MISNINLLEINLCTSTYNIFILCYSYLTLTSYHIRQSNLIVLAWRHAAIVVLLYKTFKNENKNDRVIIIIIISLITHLISILFKLISFSPLSKFFSF